MDDLVSLFLREWGGLSKRQVKDFKNLAPVPFADTSGGSLFAVQADAPDGDRAPASATMTTTAVAICSSPTTAIA